MIEKVLKNNLCTGCGLCKSIFPKGKILIEISEEGFYRPKIVTRLTKNEEILFKKVCPGRIVTKERVKTPLSDSVWGEMFSCKIGSSTSELVRKEASSGGAISAILIHLIENKKVSAVVHIGPSEALPYLNELKVSTSVAQIIESANSRYSPSCPLENIIDIVDKYEKVAFVGKPCDIAALRRYAEHNINIKSKILYYIAFFCAGVPSFKATKNIVEAMDIDMNNVSSIDYRKEGWPGYFRVIDKTGQKFKLSYSLTWMKLLGPTMQFRCKLCVDGIGHLADIVCGDAWDNFDKTGFPTFKNAPGKSLIITRTPQGEQLIEQLINQKEIKIFTEIKNFRDIDRMQPGQISKKKYFLARIIGLKLLFRMTPKFNSEFYLASTLKGSPIGFAKNIIGVIKRSV